MSSNDKDKGDGANRPDARDGANDSRPTPSRGGAQFHSRYPRLKVNLRSPEYRLAPNGKQITTKKGLSVRFENGVYRTTDAEEIKLLREFAATSRDVHEIDPRKLAAAASDDSAAGG